jgi:hypothetical protein
VDARRGIGNTVFIGCTSPEISLYAPWRTRDSRVCWRSFNHDQGERLFPRTVTGIWELLEEQRVLAKQDSDDMEVDEDELARYWFYFVWMKILYPFLYSSSS